MSTSESREVRHEEYGMSREVSMSTQDNVWPLTRADTTEEYVFRRVDGSMEAVPVEKQSELWVTSDFASDITSSSATLNGQLKGTMDSDTVDVYFVYARAGEDPPFFETSKQQLTSTGSFSAEVTGLQSGTDYEFWAVAGTLNGEIMGKDMLFTTS